MKTLKVLNDLINEQSDLLDFVIAPTPFDSAYLKAMIIERLGEVAPYRQIASDFVRDGALWFNTHGWLFDHIKNIVEAAYSPIENYNRTEELLTTNSGDDVTARRGTDSLARTGTDTLAISASEEHSNSISESGSGNRTVTNQIEGFNSAVFNDSDKEISSDNSTKSVTDEGAKSNTDSHTTTHNTTDTTTHNTTDTLTHGHIIAQENNIHGNIGVTTNQDMILQELMLLKQFNAYDYIVDRFETDLFITAYNDYFAEDEPWI